MNSGAAPLVSLDDFTDVLQGHRDGEQVVEVPLLAITDSSPVQTRATFDPEHNERDRDFAEDVRKRGVIVPVLLAPVADEIMRRYRIIAGHRRVAASRHVGKETVPALIRTLEEVEAAEVSIVENLQRSGLNPVEQALQYEAFMRITGLGADDLAQRLGAPRSSIYYTLGLLKLPGPVQQAVRDGRLNPHQAYKCAEAPEDRVAEVVEAAVERQLPAAGIEKLVAMGRESPGIPVAVLADDVASARTRDKTQPAKRGAKAQRQTPGAGEEAVVDYRRYTSTLSPQRRQSLEDVARDMQLDGVTVRRAALLLEHDPRLVVPSAVAYAQQLAQTEVGRALARIEVGVERMRLAVKGGLTPSQSKAAVLVLQHVKTWADEMIGALDRTPPAVRAGAGGEEGRGKQAKAERRKTGGG
jgi:ParB/RepB/Spo0J family partition protein